MDNAGVAVSFESVAKEAGVSRSWLYTHTELRGEIERLRGRRNSTTSRLIPDRQKISDASLVRRLKSPANVFVNSTMRTVACVTPLPRPSAPTVRAIIGGSRLLTVYHLDEKRGTKAIDAMG